MSLENKGSMPCTVYVTLDPDRSGNYPASGVADNVDIQAAINEVGRRGGGTVVLGRGTFDIAATIVDGGYSNVWIKGQGKHGATKLDLTFVGSVFNITAVTGWVISDMEIDCNKQGTGGNPGIIFDEVDDGLIIDCWVHDVDSSVSGSGYGIYLSDCLSTNVVRCKVTDCEHGGVTIAGVDGGGSKYCNIIDCYAEDNADEGASAQSGHYVFYGVAGHTVDFCNLVNSTGVDSGNMAMQFYQYCHNCYVIGGHYEDFVNEGVALGRGAGTEETCTHLGSVGATVRATGNCDSCISSWNPGSVISGNTCDGYAGVETGATMGIKCEYSDLATVTGNYISVANTHYGVRIKDSDGCTCTGNVIKGMESGSNVTAFNVTQASATTDSNTIVNNVIDTFEKLLVMNAGAVTHTTFRHNKPLNPYSWTIDWFDPGADANRLSTALNDDDADILDATEFVSTDGGPMGCLIDASGEYVLAGFSLPADVRQLNVMYIWGTSLVAEADTMMISVEVNGGGDNEPYNQHAVAAVAALGYSTNFAVNDNIVWAVGSWTDADFRQMQSNDALEIKLKYNAAVDVNCATNVLIKSIKFGWM